jgi:hypothetical protein
MKPETLFKNRVRKDLEALKKTWFVKINQVALRGIPDFLLCVNGFFVALELKKDVASSPDELQLYNLKQIKKKARGISFVAHPENWPEVLAKIKAIEQGHTITT